MSSEKAWTTALNLSGFEELAATVKQAEQTIRLTVVPRHPVAVCPHYGGVCGEVHQTRDLEGVRDLPLADRAVELRVRVAQFWCSPCGRGFTPPVPGLAENLFFDFNNSGSRCAAQENESPVPQKRHMPGRVSLRHPCLMNSSVVP